MSESGEEPIFTSLTPVMLANDDFVEAREDTYVKEVVPSEFMNGECINVSNTNQIKVTSENVEQIYDLISSETQSSQIQCAQAVQQNSDVLSVDNMVELARNVPKDLFVAQILKDFSGNRELLDTARCDIFDCIKDAADYPFDSRAALKKRIQTRSGDSVENKLAADVYCLTLVLDGADWDDLRDVINIPKPTKKSQSANDSTYCAYPYADFDLLKHSIQSLQSDMAILKQENTKMKSDFMTEIKCIRSDLTQVKDDLETELRELQTLVSTNALSIDRICDEKSNGVANIKSDIKLVKSSLKRLEDEPVFEVDIKSVIDPTGKISSLEKRLSKLERRSQADRTRDERGEHVNASRGEFQGESTGNYSDHAPKLYSTVLQNEKGKNTLVRSSESNRFYRMDIDKNCDQSVDLTMSGQTDKHMHGILNRSDPDPEPLAISTFMNPSGNKGVNLHGSSSVAQSSTSEGAGLTNGVSVPTRQSVSAHSPEINGKIQSINVHTSTKHKKPGSNTNSEQVSSRAVDDRGRKHPLPSSEGTPVTSEDDNIVNSADVLQSRRPIQVRISNRQKNQSPSSLQNDYSSSKELDDSFLANDIGFSDFVRKRTKRYYVGGFKKSITEEKLIQFIESKGLKVTWIHIWPSKRRGRVVIRLNIEACDGCDRIAERGFWPRGVKCHPWMSRNMYLKSKTKARGYNDADNYDGEQYGADDRYNGGEQYNDQYGSYDRYNSGNGDDRDQYSTYDKEYVNTDYYV